MGSMMKASPILLSAGWRRMFKLSGVAPLAAGHLCIIRSVQASWANRASDSTLTFLMGTDRHSLLCPQQICRGLEG